MLTLTRRSGSKNWQIVGKCPFTGDFVRRSTETSDYGQAQVVLTRENNRRQQEALYGGAAGTAYFAQAVIEYVKKSGNKRFVEPLLEHFGKTMLKDIDGLAMTAFCQEFYPTAQPATLVRQAYGPMQAIWNNAVAMKLAQPQTFVKPKVKRKKVVDVPGDDWLLQALAAIKATGHQRSIHQRAALLFMSFSAARASEVVAVKVKHYRANIATDPATGQPDFSRGTVLLAHTKNDEPREVPLPPFVNEVIDAMPKGGSEDPLFGYASRFSLTRILTRACRRAGIPYYSPHKAGRHAAAKRFLADGHSIKALMEAYGWKSLGAVSVYSHLERGRVEHAVRGVSTPLASVGRLEPPASVKPQHLKQALKAICERGIGSSSFVYVITCDGFAKIGTAANPTMRLMQLQVGSPRPLALHAVVPGGTEVEGLLHDFLSRCGCARRGEWFEVDSSFLIGFAKQAATILEGRNESKNPLHTGYTHRGDSQQSNT